LVDARERGENLVHHGGLDFLLYRPSSPSLFYFFEGQIGHAARAERGHDVVINVALQLQVSLYLRPALHHFEPPLAHVFHEMLGRRDVLLVSDLGACGFIERHGILMLGERLLHPLVLAAPGRNPPIDFPRVGHCFLDSHLWSPLFLGFHDEQISDGQLGYFGRFSVRRGPSSRYCSWHSLSPRRVGFWVIRSRFLARLNICPVMVSVGYNQPSGGSTTPLAICSISSRLYLT